MAQARSATRIQRLHPLAVRIMHWTNAIAMLLLILSGWKIYNDEVLFGWLHFPDWMTIGGEAQGALQWHFFAMWILMVNGVCYLAYGFLTGRFRRKLVPNSSQRCAVDCSRRLALAPRSRRHHALQRCSEGSLCRCHRRHRRAGSVGLGGVEACPAVGAGGLVRKLPRLAIGSFPRHGGNRRLPARSCRSGAAGAKNDRRDDHGRSSRGSVRRFTSRDFSPAPCRMIGEPMSVRSPSPSVFRPATGVDQSILESNKALLAEIGRRGVLRGSLGLGALTPPALPAAPATPIPSPCQ